MGDKQSEGKRKSGKLFFSLKYSVPNTMANMGIFVLVLLVVRSFQFENDDQQNFRSSRDAFYNRFLKNVRKYERVDVRDEELDPNAIVPHFYGQDEKVEKSISFLYYGQKIILDLVPNKNLLSRYQERVFLPDGKAELIKPTYECFFHGHVRNEVNSNLALSACDGYEGYFTIKEETLFIHPLYNKKGQIIAHAVYSPKDVVDVPFKCGIHGSHEYDLKNVFRPRKHHRNRRSGSDEIKIVELLLVNDHSQFLAYGPDIGSIKRRAIGIANVADAMYKVHNIRICLVFIKTWKSKDPISVVAISTRTLTNFKDYKIRVLNANNETKNHDTAHLLTQTRFAGGSLGVAYRKVICDPSKSLGIVSDHGKDVAATGAMLAHEIGHNFGLVHDHDCCNSTSNRCIMDAMFSISDPPTKFSPCSLADLDDLLLIENVGHCLSNLPRKLATHPACGNGFVDDGEQCDCGTKEDCERVANICCNHTTCMLPEGKQCSGGGCCTRDCRIMPVGTVCRSAANACDVPEFCNGTSAMCPADLVVQSGVPCDGNQGYCYQGRCQTHNRQCAEYWTGGAVKADDICYNVGNIKGNSSGYCNMTSLSDYVACTAENVLCGKLHCTGDDIQVNNKSYRVTIRSYNSSVCRSVMYKFSDEPNLGTVEDGTKCGEQKVCKNHQCVPLSAAYPAQSTCQSNCSGNGICNENGNCHCFARWRCRNCSLSYCGPGGSIDSGLGCDMDELQHFPSPCHVNSICDNSNGAYHCACNAGYSGNGTVCYDINECDVLLNPCHANATCNNSVGSYECTCDSGFRGDGLTHCDAKEEGPEVQRRLSSFLKWYFIVIPVLASFFLGILLTCVIYCIRRNYLKKTISYDDVRPSNHLELDVRFSSISSNQDVERIYAGHIDDISSRAYEEMDSNTLRQHGTQSSQYQELCSGERTDPNLYQPLLLDRNPLSTSQYQELDSQERTDSHSYQPLLLNRNPISEHVTQTSEYQELNLRERTDSNSYQPLLLDRNPLSQHVIQTSQYQELDLRERTDSHSYQPLRLHRNSPTAQI